VFGFFVPRLFEFCSWVRWVKELCTLNTILVLIELTNPCTPFLWHSSHAFVVLFLSTSKIFYLFAMDFSIFFPKEKKNKDILSLCN
jgi:hypothetical protein